MKRYWLLSLILLSAAVSADDAFAPDKRAHFAGGVIAGGIGAGLANKFVPAHRFVVGQSSTDAASDYPAGKMGTFVRCKRIVRAHRSA